MRPHHRWTDRFSAIPNKSATPAAHSINKETQYKWIQKQTTTSSSTCTNTPYPIRSTAEPCFVEIRQQYSQRLNSGKISSAKHRQKRKYRRQNGGIAWPPTNNKSFTHNTEAQEKASARVKILASSSRDGQQSWLVFRLDYSIHIPSQSRHGTVRKPGDSS